MTAAQGVVKDDEKESSPFYAVPTMPNSVKRLILEVERGLTA